MMDHVCIFCQHRNTGYSEAHLNPKHQYTKEYATPNLQIDLIAVLVPAAVFMRLANCRRSRHGSEPPPRIVSVPQQGAKTLCDALQHAPKSTVTPLICIRPRLDLSFPVVNVIIHPDWSMGVRCISIDHLAGRDEHFPGHLGSGSTGVKMAVHVALEQTRT
jgi:hypothetical protein